MPHAEVTLPGDTSSVPTARRFVEDVLTTWGHPEHGWTAALLISELSANCTLHARTAYTVSVELEGELIRLQVSDGSRRSPAVRDYGSTATTGRGLRLVEELATTWGVELREDGKTVWAVLQPDADGRGSVDDEADLDALLATFGEDDVEQTGDPLALAA